MKRNLREIGRELGTAYLLEGTVQREGSRVRVNVQLIDARSDTHIWAESYDRDVADLFALESELAETIVTQLKSSFPGRENRDRDAIDLRSTRLRSLHPGRRLGPGATV